MKRDDIIRAVVQSNDGNINELDTKQLVWRLDNFKDDSYQFGPDQLLKFVAMIEAAEREACAMACMSLLYRNKDGGITHARSNKTTFYNSGVSGCVAVIRERGQS